MVRMIGLSVLLAEPIMDCRIESGNDANSRSKLDQAPDGEISGAITHQRTDVRLLEAGAPATRRHRPPGATEQTPDCTGFKLFFSAGNRCNL
jgi:hypothetical protein